MNLEIKAPRDQKYPSGPTKLGIKELGVMG
jgi:hypothetical protein